MSIAATVLSFVLLGCLSVIGWMFREARIAGSNKTSVKTMKKELIRAQEMLDTLSSPLPSPRDALDRMSNTNGRAGSPVPYDESSDTASVRVSVRDRHQ